MGLKKGNKQAELAKRMQLAKQQRENTVPDDEKEILTDQEMKEKNDRLRFDAMLKSSAVTVGSEYESDGYLSQSQEEEEIQAARSGADRLFEGDPAPAAPFEELVSIKSENAIGEGGASRLVPWLRKNVDRRSDYLIILSEPRLKSPELRASMKSLSIDLPADIMNRLIVVNADSPAENRRWIKKNNCFNVDIYSDEKREWMRAYTALGKDRLSMSLFVVADERIKRLAREVDGLQAMMVVTNAVKSLDLK
jgi:sugar diacid utilization regulator